MFISCVEIGFLNIDTNGAQFFFVPHSVPVAGA
jgi:hypothetical protein